MISSNNDHIELEGYQLLRYSNMVWNKAKAEKRLAFATHSFLKNSVRFFETHSLTG